RRGWHAFDLDDLDQIPRVATSAHLNMSTKTHYLIHALVEAAAGVRSTIVADRPRYLASHFRAIAEENRYRAEQGMRGTKGNDQPIPVFGGFEFHFTEAGRDVASEVWHLTGATISSIDYSG